MPNWTYNNTQIKGNKVDVANFLNTIIGKDDKGEYYYDFTKCSPMPVELENLHQGSRNIDGVTVDAWYEDGDDVRPMMDMVKDRLIKEHKTYKPIDWQYNNWGTKWGDCATELLSDETVDDTRTLEFYFESAWGEPFRLLNDIAIKFNLDIENKWDIELGNGDGISTYPWTPEDTEQIYTQHEYELESMRNAVRDFNADTL